MFKKIAQLLIVGLLSFVCNKAYSTTNLTVNGITYAFPTEDDQNWGATVTNWATAVTNGMLQKAGGTFTLTNDAYFGANYGLKSSYYKGNSLLTASTGTLRLATSNLIAWRNNANTADLTLSIDANDNLVFNGILVSSQGLASVSQINSTYTFALNGINNLNTSTAGFTLFRSTAQTTIDAIQTATTNYVSYSVPASSNMVLAGPVSGAAANPSFRVLSGFESGLVLIASATASNSSSIVFNNLPTNKFTDYVLIGEKILAGTGNTYPRVRFQSSTGTLSGNLYSYANIRYSSSAIANEGMFPSDNISIINGDTLGTNSDQLLSFKCEILSFNMGDTKTITSGTARVNSQTYISFNGGGSFYGSQALFGIEYTQSSGNIASGNFYLFAYRKY